MFDPSPQLPVLHSITCSRDRLSYLVELKQGKSGAVRTQGGEVGREGIYLFRFIKLVELQVLLLVAEEVIFGDG